MAMQGIIWSLIYKNIFFNTDDGIFPKIIYFLLLTLHSQPSCVVFLITVFYTAKEQQYNKNEEKPRIQINSVITELKEIY